uniref:N-acetyltransferase ESCO2 n=1 Tax=Timema monikensis TaxID=170555 RepID=A0A7R9HSN8_9NEOP|nr:unnamed protein product [Timema monikensis]
MAAHLLQTPLKSARKRNLFPKSPTAESSDGSLGHMSPLPSSPDRYSSAPHTPQNWMLETPPRGMSDHSPVQGRCFDSLRFRLSHSKSTFSPRRSPRRQTAATDQTIFCGETIPETPLKSPPTYCSRTPFMYLEKSATTLTPKHKISKHVVEESPDTESLGVLTPSKSSNKKGQSLTTISPSTFYKPVPARTAPARILFPELGSNSRIKSFFGGVTRDSGDVVRKLGAMKPKLSQSGTKRKAPEPPTPPPDPSKKFFKTNRTIGINKKKTVTVDANIRLEVSNGKFSLEKSSVKPKFCKNLNYQLNNAEVTNALFEPLDVEEGQTLQVKSSVNQILEQLDKDSSPVSNDSHILPVVSLCRLPQDMESMVSDNNTIYKGDVERIIALTPPKKGTTKGQGVSPSGAKTDTRRDLTVTSSLSPLMVKRLNNTNTSLGHDVEPLLDEEAKSTEKENCEKYYPLFNSPARQEKRLTDLTNKKTPRSSKRLWWPLGNDQYQIDAGQKKFGATQCSDCGIVYQQGDPDDEMSHLNFHNSSKSLKFAGWKQERVVGEYGNGRVVLITPNDSKVWCKKAADVVGVADKDLGYAESGLNISNSKVYLYIEDRQVVGCLVAEHVTEAHRLLSSAGLDTCSEEMYPVKCGISRIWTLINCRRRGIATRLVNCMRGNFIYGYILSSCEFAFSVPTVSGKEFASKYMGTPHFLVYT